MFPKHKPTPTVYQPDESGDLVIADFSAGMNMTDPAEMLPENQFSLIHNFLLSRKGVLETRQPYRPYPFNSSNVDDCIFPAEVTRIEDYKVVQAVVSGWSTAGEIHVIVGYKAGAADGKLYSVYARLATPPVWSAGTYDADDGYKINDGVIYIANTSTAEEPPHANWTKITGGWVEIWESSTACTGVSVASYQINKAVDLIVFPNDTHPERYAFATSTLSDLGLACPADTYLTITNITAANPGVVTSVGHELVTGDVVYIKDVVGDMGGVVNNTPFVVTWVSADTFSIGVSTAAKTYTSGGKAGTLAVPYPDTAVDEGAGIRENGEYFYKYSYFYDTPASSTKYGESSLSEEASHVVISGLTSGQAVTVTVHNIVLPSGVTKARIYRTPAGAIEGPYRLIGEVTASGDFTDSIALGEEGIEGLPDGTNPSESGSELAVVNVTNLSGTLLGFDASLLSKAIRCVPGYPDVWIPTDFDYLDGNGKGAVEFNRQVFVFTNKACYQKESVVGPAYLVSRIGTVDGRSIQNVGNGICWMDYDSVYFADFVQQYGSKGDFPKDIGHPISDDSSDCSLSLPISSAFFEQRYYLTFYTDTAQVRKTYVYDVDFACWTLHSMKHEALAAGINTLYSAGFETVYGEGSSTSYGYAFRHGHLVIVVVGDESAYAGWDWHDYQTVTVNSCFSDSLPILAVVSRDDVRLGGLFRDAFVSSATLYASGDSLDVDITFTLENASAKTLTFTAEPVAVSYPAIWDADTSVWAEADDPFEIATEAEPGYAALNAAAIRDHKKVNRNVKDKAIDIVISAEEARDLKILLVRIRYKVLPDMA